MIINHFELHFPAGGAKEKDLKRGLFCYPSLRLDDIQPCGLMICNSFEIDDIHALRRDVVMLFFLLYARLKTPPCVVILSKKGIKNNF